jgi:hypothetical protein
MQQAPQLVQGLSISGVVIEEFATISSQKAADYSQFS